jgi:hypothetical protein
VTVRVAGGLVKALTLFVTVTENVVPLSALEVAGVVYVAELAPAIGTPFLFHW